MLNLPLLFKTNLWMCILYYNTQYFLDDLEKSNLGIEKI